MIYNNPSAADIINASATATTAGIVTVPGGRWLTADVQISATVAVAGTSSPNITYVVPGGTAGAAPANGAVLARVTAAGLLAAASANSSTVEILVYGGDNGCTINFTAGASGASSVVINGFLI
jgi:hypothetical protein